MLGHFLIDILAVAILTYAATEYLLAHFDVRQRVIVGDGWPLMPILTTNGLSFLAVSILSVLALFVAGANHYAEAVMLCLCLQGIWLARHLWFYHRDHLRLGYE